MQRLLILAAMLFISGCIPYFEHPITAPEEQQMDISINGSWFWRGESEHGFLHIGLDSETGLLHMTMLDFNASGQIKTDTFTGHTTVLAGKTYLNLRWVDRPSERNGYLFVKYKLGRDTLGISTMDTFAVERAIEKGLLKAELKKEQWFSSIFVTDDSKRLRQFVRDNDFNGWHCRMLFCRQAKRTKKLW